MVGMRQFFLIYLNNAKIKGTVTAILWVYFPWYFFSPAKAGGKDFWMLENSVLNRHSGKKEESKPQRPLNGK